VPGERHEADGSAREHDRKAEPPSRDSAPINFGPAAIPIARPMKIIANKM
jgi:hypothetical protein